MYERVQFPDDSRVAAPTIEMPWGRQTHDLRRTFANAVGAYEQAVATHRKAVGAYAVVARLIRTGLRTSPNEAPHAPNRAAATDNEPLSIRLRHEDDGATGLPASDPLTPRQREVATLVARGYTNLQIATELVLEQGTVANHVAQVIDRLGVRNRTQVATWALQRGLL